MRYYNYTDSEILLFFKSVRYDDNCNVFFFPFVFKSIIYAHIFDVQRIAYMED